MYNQKYSIDTKYISRPTENVNERNGSTASEQIAIVRGTFPCSSNKDVDEVNFSYESSENHRKCNRVRLQSNSPSSIHSMSESNDSVSEVEEFEDQAQILNSTVTAGSKSYKNSNSSIDRMVRDYCMVNKKD